MRRLLEIGVSALLPLAALVVLVLATRGAFRGATTLPPIFAGVMVVAGVLSLLSRRRRAVRWQVVAVVLSMALSLAAVAAHRGFLGRERRAAEEAGMAALARGPAPPIPYRHAVNQGPAEPRPIAFGGAWTVVNFWATWCDPCREEMPALERFWREHRGDGLRVVGVTRLWGGEGEASAQREQQEIGRFVAELGVTYPVVVSDAATMDAYRVEAWPTSVLIGPDGRAVAYGVGIDGAEQLLARAAGLLQGPG